MSPTEKPRPTVLISSVSSDGLINLYDLESFLTLKPIAGSEIRQGSPLASYDTKGSRLTCVFLADGKSAQAGTALTGLVKRKSTLHQERKAGSVHGGEDSDSQDGDMIGSEDVEDVIYESIAGGEDSGEEPWAGMEVEIEDEAGYD